MPSGVIEDKRWDENGNIGEIFGSPDDHLIELFSCVAVDLPSYKYKIEKHQTGNTYHKIVLPDYTANPTFSLTLAETDTYDIDELLKFIIRRNVKHAGLPDMEYVDNGWVDVINVDILNNDLNKKVLRYQFGFCRLVDYTVYDLSYTASDLPTYKLTFSFESFKKIYEPDIASDDYDPNAIFDETRNRYNHLMQDTYNTKADRKYDTKNDGTKTELKVIEKENAESKQTQNTKTDKAKSTPSLQNQINANNTKIEALTEQLKTAENRFDEIKAGASSITNSVQASDYSKSITNAQQTVAGLKSQIEALQKTNDSLHAKQNKTTKGGKQGK